MAAATLLTSTTGCIKEIDPQTSIATKNQVAAAPGVFDSFVGALTSTLTGQFVYGGADNKYANDFGLPSFWLMRDVSGNDLVYPYQNWYSSWYGATGLGPSTRNAQYPWTYYYKWIKSCNEVIFMAGEEPIETQKAGAAKAYALRAYYYMDLARMFAQEPYGKNKEAVTVPIIDEKTTSNQSLSNPRATNEVMWDFILSDLNKAEALYEGYTRTDVYDMDQSVVYGLKARAYLEMEDWANAEKYAKLAQAGYTMMDEAAYTSWETGFNTPNASWMFAITYKSDDPCITVNDADSSWGSMMCIEIDPKNSGCGYAANYGQPFVIDYHLYNTIPATDWRKKCYVDFAIDDMSRADQLTALSAYTNHPDWLLDGCGAAVHDNGYEYTVGGLELKFRTAGGEAGRANQYIGFVVAIPLMRVEEMYLIEAEAAGMQQESRGIQLLTAFAKTRDANYTYGEHGHETYYNTSTSQFQNEVWWQRRVELWGEGFATFDIKRLQKGIIRSYPGTNHTENYRWNVESVPSWMSWCIVQTETNYNTACTNNPEPVPPTSDSSEYQW